MSDILDKLKQGQNNVRTVNLNGAYVGLRLLAEQDHHDAQLATINALKAAGITDYTTATADIYESEAAAQLLLRAMVDPDTKEQAGGSIQILRKVLTREQRNYLIKEYNEHEKECSPDINNMSEEQFRELFETLKKSPDTIAWDDLSSETAKRLLRTLACQLAD